MCFVSTLCVWSGGRVWVVTGGCLVLFQWARWENQAAEFHRTLCVMGLNLCEHKLSDLDPLSEKNHNKDVYRDLKKHAKKELKQVFIGSLHNLQSSHVRKLCIRSVYSSLKMCASRVFLLWRPNSQPFSALPAFSVTMKHFSVQT